MFFTVLNCFGRVVATLRNITINLGSFEFSLFNLLFGVLIFATLCRTYLKYIFELPLNFKVNDHHSLTEYIDRHGEIYKVVKSRWY